MPREFGREDHCGQQNIPAECLVKNGEDRRSCVGDWSQGIIRGMMPTEYPRRNTDCSESIWKTQSARSISYDIPAEYAVMRGPQLPVLSRQIG